MSSALGLIFSNIHDDNIPELTTKRTIASIPFCGRYRLIDFALSNMVNSDIAKVGIITPTPWVGNNEYDSKTTDEEYVQVIIDICKKRGIPCLDLYHNSGLRPWEESYRTLCYSKDGGNGVHPDETGHRLIAPRFRAFLETLM